MTARNITRTGQASSCYFRTTADGGTRKALVQIDERCNLHCAHCFVSATTRRTRSTPAALPRRLPRRPAETLPELRDAVRRWATALAGDDQHRNPDAVRQQLAARKLNGRSSIEAYARHAIASS